MRLRYIELFHAVLSTGSLTGAASLLNVSQPAASKALQQAENHLGFPLFSRVRGRLQPTPQALLMRHQIDKLMRDLYDLRRLALNITRPESHPLRVTCTPALAQVLVPDAIARLGEVYPETIVELFTQHSAVMCESLMLREADIGLTLQDINHHGLVQEPLCRGNIKVIAPPGWWPARELDRPLPIKALAGQPMIGITVQDALGAMLQNHLAKVEPAPQTRVWVQTYQLACSLVARGGGLALVDPFTAQCSREPVQTRPLKLEMDVVLYAVYRPDSPLNGVQSRFLDVMRQRAQAMLSDAA
ncbi:LysR substrate-binding domain-containing protein [Dyella jiangningensis]|uniref:LysR family transcriptional regulator n=1 Tax=Dyella jiangningensis TaxID=1379159 RepID=UPI00240ED89E|nr:LysR substrate-binding domain-containing protein [Dyella jiangningensis]MDG2536944.1 LysR substrate-binding domain-containing protein [Dyella jiangningensis]